MEQQTATIEITYHAQQRAKQRLSLSRKSFTRLAKKAFYEGLNYTNTKGRLHRYIKAKFKEYESADNIRVYGEVVYLFAGCRLITLYILPHELKKCVKYHRD